MNSHIVMVHIVSDATVSYSHGLASLAAILIESGYKPELLRLVTVRTDNCELETERILELNPFIVLMTCTSNQWDKARTMGRSLKEKAPDLVLCIGGSHVTAFPNSNSWYPFDVGVAGEGEEVITAIIKEASKGASKVNELNETLGRRMVIIENLDKLPFPYLEMFDREELLEYPSVMFSRGCPFKCSYCMSRNGGLGGTIRSKSPERAIREVIQFVNYAQPDEIYIDDDAFLKNPRWVAEFCKLYRQKVKVPFYCNSRPETITREQAEYLGECNCRGIGIGIESGSYRIRKDILQREMSDEVIVRSFEIARKAGLQTWSFNMVGIPTETSDELMATIRLNEQVQTDFIRVSIFTSYPGTPIYDVYCPNVGYCQSYFRSANDLPKSLKDIYDEWVRALAREGRLWYTEAESKQVLQ